MNRIFKRIALTNYNNGAHIHNSGVPDTPDNFEDPVDLMNARGLNKQDWQEIKDTCIRNTKNILTMTKQIDTLIKNNDNQEKISMLISDTIEELYDTIDALTNFNDSLEY